MKKIIAIILAACFMTSSAIAATWWNNGVLYGNICHSLEGPNFQFFNARYPVNSPCSFVVNGYFYQGYIANA